MARKLAITTAQDYQAWRDYLAFLERHMTLCEANLLNPEADDPKPYRRAQLAAATKARDAVLKAVTTYQEGKEVAQAIEQ